MSVENMLMPGERILSECKPFYATSRRIIRYDDGLDGEPMAEITYPQLTGVQLARKPSHPLMLAGTVAILGAVFLTLVGVIFFTSILALAGGIAMLAFGARGKVGYYRLLVQVPGGTTSRGLEAEPGSGLGTIMEALGLKSSDDEARWRLDYPQGGSFIATVRNIKGELPEL